MPQCFPFSPKGLQGQLVFIEDTAFFTERCLWVIMALVAIMNLAVVAPRSFTTTSPSWLPTSQAINLASFVFEAKDVVTKPLSAQQATRITLNTWNINPTPRV
ncbi:hypothetical protein QBC36DRAFT_314533 [Triangularia setosa]|uniref:Uncharacterized protein n=1 Tax=Triangularia setosa TaxID=2587417 RepID=A0AAN7A535_9PEZI|nr:hypothetical protein QBC36DRAFT_314533 [Podospora setosa]